jgi:hypothetical protein
MDKNNILEYYKNTSGITSIGKYTEFINWLSDDIRVIFQTVQGLLIHGAWLNFYEVSADDYKFKEFHNIYIQELIDKVLELDNSSLGIPRSPDKRIIVSCREFATLFCAILRAKDIPARCRCGFSSYLARDGYYEDHWICEYWNEGRWIKVDPQIDPFQQSSLENWILNSTNTSISIKKIIKELNPLDLSNNDFITSGEAWLKCRKGTYDPNKFGIYGDPNQFGIESLYGLWFIRGNLLRDFASLNRVETVPLLNRLENSLSWESWRLLYIQDSEIIDEDLKLLDEIAGLTIDIDSNFYKILETYKSNQDLQVPTEILKEN